MRLHAAAVLLLVPVLRAQADLIGVTFSGQAIAFDSHTGDGRLLTTNAIAGQNAMARIGNTLFSTDRTVAGTTLRFGLGNVDAATGAYTQLHAVIGDLRGLCEDPTNPHLLCGILQNDPDLLVLIDPVPGLVQVIGSTSTNGIQALCVHQGQLLAWDVNQGLMRINRNTGLAADVNHQVGGSTGVQFLMVHSDGRLLGGQQALFEIDPSTGVLTGIGAIAGGTFDVRGAEERMALLETFGTGCSTVQNTPSHLFVNGPVLPGTQLSLSSQRHEPQHLAVLVLGFDHHRASGQPLPLLLDPLLGTSGCRLLTSIDLTATSFTNSLGSYSGSLALPPNSGAMTFVLQLAVFESVQGGMSWSDGMLVKVGQ